MGFLGAVTAPPISGIGIALSAPSCPVSLVRVSAVFSGLQAGRVQDFEIGSVVTRRGKNVRTACCSLLDSHRNSCGRCRGKTDLTKNTAITISTAAQGSLGRD